MLNEFESYYNELSESYQIIVNSTMRTMEKEHKKTHQKQVLNIKSIIKHYLKKNNMRESNLINKCYEIDETFSENTYKSIKKRNIVNIKDNETIKTVSKVLNIPRDKKGNLYIESSEKLQVNNTIKHKHYSFTKEGYAYMTEFQANSIYANFLCLRPENQRTILTLARNLYFYQTSPELFTNNEEIAEI